jgi:hypothetical protein
MKMNDEKTEGQPETPPEKPKPQWEYRKNFKINERMKHIVNLTIQATNSEIKSMRRKIDKLKYGS